MRDTPFSTSLNHLGFIYMRWFPGTSAGKESACNVGDVGLIPRLERSPGEGNGKPLQHSCLENSMNRGAWQVHGVTKSWMRLSDFHFTIQFSHSVMSNSLWLHGLDHARLPYPSPTPGICSNSCPSSQWCYPTISPSVIPFSFCLQSFPASGSFPKYWSFCFSLSPSNEYLGLISFIIDWFDLLAIQETLKSLLQHYSSEASVLQCSAFFILSYLYMTTGKTIAFTRWTFVGKALSLPFNMLSRFVIYFLPKSKCLLISLHYMRWKHYMKWISLH